jgi:type IV secretion system protein VirD4
MSRFASAPWPLKAAYVGLLGTTAAAALCAVAAGVALGGLHRLSPHLQVSQVPAWFWYYRHDPQVRRWAGAGALTALMAAGVTAVGVARNLRPPLHGAARWASEAEMARGGLRARLGIVLGRKGGRLITFGGSEHVLIHAPTRSGKGVGVVIPNLLNWPDSAVVLDVKRENWDATAGFRAAHGQRAILFDPFDAEGRTARFNPLGYIDRADPIQVLDELQKLAAMLFATHPGQEPFWTDSARTGFIGVASYVAETPDLPFTFGAVYAQLSQGDPRTRLPQEIAARAAAGPPLSPGCVQALSDFCGASENTFASVRQTLTSRLNLWLNPRVCAATAASDFDLRDLRTQAISLYLVATADNLVRVAPLYNLLFQQLVDLNTRERPGDGRHPRQVLLILDEFARLGHAAVLAHAFAYVAGFGLRLMPVLQSPAQLRAEYGPDLAEEIMTNCGVELAFAPKDLRTARDLSARLGDYTYEARSLSRPAGLSSGRRSQTESGQRRALLMPQELSAMPDHQLIILRAGLPAVRGRKIVYWRERAFASRVLPPPGVPPCPMALPEPRRPDDPLRLALPDFDGLEALPPEGATPAEVEAWVERYIDTAARPATGGVVNA